MPDYRAFFRREAGLNLIRRAARTGSAADVVRAGNIQLYMEAYPRVAQAALSGYGAYQYGRYAARAAIGSKPVRTVGRGAAITGKLGLAGGALLAGMGTVGIGGGLYEAYSAGQDWKAEEESDYMQKLLATAQQGPFGTGLRPYGMGSNFGGSAGMSLAMHYARNGTGIRNPLFSIASLASRDIRGRLS